ncbi:hypothetical protein HanRHA438_Chr04g0187231 [Helianthus annuus]|nr:hypothetical protein HanRHA438_Chr04g0187231 [Helianthus annuus]
MKSLQTAVRVSEYRSDINRVFRKAILIFHGLSKINMIILNGPIKVNLNTDMELINFIKVKVLKFI